jgi:CRP-like cAMP-binding protein
VAMHRRRNEKADRIRRVSLFAALSKQGLNEVVSIADEVELPEGAKLTREGEIAREFFVLLDGSVEVRKKGRWLATLVAGDFFGEIGLLAKVPRTATVTATSPVRALVIGDPDFRALLQHRPEISMRIAEALGRRFTAALS